MSEAKNNYVGRIVQWYRAEHGLTQTALAEILADVAGSTLSKASVSYWEKGIFRPNRLLLRQIVLRCVDWRKDFALDCLAAIEPEFFKPVSDIGVGVLAGIIVESVNSMETSCLQDKIQSHEEFSSEQ